MYSCITQYSFVPQNTFRFSRAIWKILLYFVVNIFFLTIFFLQLNDYTSQNDIAHQVGLLFLYSFSKSKILGQTHQNLEMSGMYLHWVLFHYHISF